MKEESNGKYLIEDYKNFNKFIDNQYLIKTKLAELLSPSGLIR